MKGGLWLHNITSTKLFEKVSKKVGAIKENKGDERGILKAWKLSFGG